MTTLRGAYQSVAYRAGGWGTAGRAPGRADRQCLWAARGARGQMSGGAPMPSTTGNAFPRGRVTAACRCASRVELVVAGGALPRPRTSAASGALFARGPPSSARQGTEQDTPSDVRSDRQDSAGASTSRCSRARLCRGGGAAVPTASVASRDATSSNRCRRIYEPATSAVRTRRCRR